VSSSSALSVEEGFRRWAPTYDVETPLSLLEERLFREMAPAPTGLRILDAGCGTGRRLQVGAGGGPSLAVGVDLVRAMLLAGSTRGPLFVQGDLRALPLRADQFDLVWCRLTLGFVDDPMSALAELGRVTREGGSLLITELHPRTARADVRRTFRDAQGQLWSVAHHVHAVATLETAARQADLSLVYRDDMVVGPDNRSVFEAHRALDRYEALLGSPVVLGMRWVKSTSEVVEPNGLESAVEATR
jgi:malonyl-CoA O-methyltransferase